MQTTTLSNDHIKIYQAIADQKKDRVFEHWHASSIAECPRAHFLKRKGVKPTREASAALQIRWGAGHAIEKSIRPAIEALYPDVKSNERLTSLEYDLTGEYDNYSKKEQTIIEIKSVHDYAFKVDGDITGLKEQIGEHNGRRQWSIKHEPYLHHQMQNHCYYILMKEEKLPVAYIDYVYISLSGRVVTYHTKINEDILNHVRARLETLNEAWLLDEPPKCICYEQHELWGPVMQYCDYKDDDECCKRRSYDSKNV